MNYSCGVGSTADDDFMLCSTEMQDSPTWLFPHDSTVCMTSSFYGSFPATSALSGWNSHATKDEAMWPSLCSAVTV
jgi:hypothetical protein